MSRAETFNVRASRTEGAMGRALRLSLLLCFLGYLLYPETPRAPLRLGTFNIEHFPRSERQVTEAFALIASLNVSALAVQEITDPARFAREARARLGESWRFVHTEPPARFHLGLLYDQQALTLLSTRTYPELQRDAKTKPGFEARLKTRDGQILRLLVVHLASSDERFGVRAEQHKQLQAIVASAKQSGEPLIVLGDFNATTEGDRALLSQLAQRQQLTWASEALSCTAYWQRRSQCTAAALDHVLSSQPLRAVSAGGACQREGCQARDRCPDEVATLSDHCPVLFELP